MSDLIRHLSILQSHVFLLNSRLGHFSAPHRSGGLFSRSYETNLPSSLAMTHSSALGFSPRLPVSVCGTGCAYLKLKRLFLEEVLAHYPRRPKPLRYYLPLSEGFNARIRQCAMPLPLRPRNRSMHRRGNINPLAIGFAFRLILRTRLTLIR